MHTFKYKAIKAGRVINGFVNANDGVSAKMSLASQGINVVSINKVDGKTSSSLPKKYRLSHMDQVSFFLHIAQMDKAGINMKTSLHALSEVAVSNKLQKLGTKLLEMVESGLLLSDAIRSTECCDLIFADLIAVAEKTGSIANVSSLIVSYIKRSVTIERGIKKALFKPAMSIAFMILMMCVVSTVVAPKMTMFLKDNNIDMPLASRSLFGFATFIKGYWPFLIIGIVGFVIGIVMIRRMRVKKIIRFFDTIKLHFPFFGPLILKIEMSKTATFLSLLLGSGVTLSKSLENVSMVVKNSVIHDIMVDISQRVNNGSSFHNACTFHTNILPRLFVSMISIGEESNDIQNTIMNVREFYDTEVSDGVENITAALKPTMMILMASMVMWMAAGMLGPIYGNVAKMVG